MKVRESGMPEQSVWDSYFEPQEILQTLGLTAACQNLIEFGCGYGTFTVAAAELIGGQVIALDIDPQMLEVSAARARDQGLNNIEFKCRDFVNDGSGLPSGRMDYAMLFNILHHEQPVTLLREVYRNLSAGGCIGIIHWNHDPETPRGPPMSMRPKPEQCMMWAEQAGFIPDSGVIKLPPYHYGMVLRRPGR